jgi:hypothetical protein
MHRPQADAEIALAQRRWTLGDSRDYGKGNCEGLAISRVWGAERARIAGVIWSYREYREAAALAALLILYANAPRRGLRLSLFMTKFRSAQADISPMA